MTQPPVGDSRPLQGNKLLHAERERLVVTMHHAEEMTLAEIGEVLGIHPGNVGRALTVAQHKRQERLRAHAQAWQA